MGSTVRKSEKWERMQSFSELLNYWKANNTTKTVCSKKVPKCAISRLYRTKGLNETCLRVCVIKWRKSWAGRWRSEGPGQPSADGRSCSHGRCLWAGARARDKSLSGLTVKLFTSAWWRVNCSRSIRRGSQNYFSPPEEEDWKGLEVKSIRRVNVLPLPVVENGRCC